jgi:gliding motility-associated-like protein
MKKFIKSVILITLCCIFNLQAVPTKLLNLGPDINFCPDANSSYVVNPFTNNIPSNPAYGLFTTTSYTNSAITYNPSSYTTGTTITNFNTDDCISNFMPIGFNFSFYGFVFSHFRLSSNNILMFANPPTNANQTNFPTAPGCAATGTSISGTCNGGYTAYVLNGLGSLGSQTNTLPRNAIFFAGIDVNPNIGGSVRTELTGVAPNRVLTIKFNNIPYFSCTSLLYRAQLKLFETSNEIEIHIEKKQTCNWQNNVGIVGIQGNVTTQSSFIAGYNNQSFNFNTPKAWRFVPSGPLMPPNPPYVIRWDKLGLPAQAPVFSNSLTLNNVPASGVCYKAQFVMNNASHTALNSCLNNVPDTICFVPTYIQANVVNSNNICAGDSLGTINVNVTGLNPWQILLYNNQTQALIQSFNQIFTPSYLVDSLGSGDYLLSVIDNAGCTDSILVTINQPEYLQLNVSNQTNILCFGNSTGAISVNATGGVQPYLYSINGGAYSFNSNFSSLPAGNYTVCVKDMNSCTSCVTVTITQPPLLTLSETNVDVLCFGLNTGSISLTGNGGVQPYTFFQASNSNTTGLFENLTANTYNCNVTDANGCVSTAQIAITQPFAALTASLASQQNVSCYNLSDGIITMNANFGTAPYTYSISPLFAFQNSNVFNGLATDNYTVQVKDNNNCTVAVNNLIITQPNPLNITLSSQQNVGCFSENTGKVCVNAQGGFTNASSYNWVLSNNSNGAVYNENNIQTVCFDNLIAGTYALTVSDVNLCTQNLAINITEPIAALQANIASFTNVTCHGFSNGTVTVQGANGTSPYWYSLPLLGVIGVVNPTIGGLSSDINYTFTVIDNNGCTAQVSQQLTQPLLPLQGTIDAFTNANCFGVNNGSITVSATNGTGTAPYSYSYNTNTVFQSNGLLNNLYAGNYTVVIKDTNNCVLTLQQALTEPTQLQAELFTQSATCFGYNNGECNAQITGGVPPYNYIWNNVLPATNAHFKNDLYANNHNLSVYDNNGCQRIFPFIIDQPAQLEVFTKDTIHTCVEDKIILSASAAYGTPGYTYHWLPNNYPDKDTITALLDPSHQFNNFQIFVTDNNNCVSQTKPVTVVIRAKPEIAFFTNDTAGCEPHCIDLKNSTTITSLVDDVITRYKWDLSNNKTSTEFDLTTCFERPATYDVCLTAQTNRNCITKVCKEKYIHVYPVPLNDYTYAQADDKSIINPYISFEANIIPKATYSWVFDEENKTSFSNKTGIVHKFENEGRYEVQLITKSEYGCLDTARKTIEINPIVLLYVPTAFTPNNDGINDSYTIKGENVPNLEFFIYNRWGELLHTQTNTSEDSNWKPVNPPFGIYHWKALYDTPQGMRLTKTGSFTIVK